MQIYEVKAGDSLWAIARRFGTSTETLRLLNQLGDPSRLVIGQSLLVPGGDAAPRRPIEVNAYVYPNVQDSVLSGTLPYLTALSPFSHSVEASGALRPLRDERLIEAAYAEQAAPLLVVTNLAESGGFSSDLAHTVLTDEAVQDRLLENIVALIREKDYYGLNLDFEYLYPFDRDSYSNFVRHAAERLHMLGCPVATALAPKESAAQEGYLYGAPQAISPVDRIRRVLDYAVGAIPAGKILMGLSNYAYDWTLPWRQGTAARLLSNAGAQELAVSRGAEIHFDKKAEAPWFNYVDAEGLTHVVWFEDARSVRARLRLVEEYGLAGVSIWTADRLWQPIPALIESLYSVEKIL